MSTHSLELERLAFFDLELDPFIEVGIRTLPEHEEEEPEGSGGLEIDIVLLSERGTKINSFHGTHGRPLFNGAVALGQEAQGHVEIKLAELPPVCVGLWILAVGSQEWRRQEPADPDVPVEMMVAVSGEPAVSGQIVARAAAISSSGGSVALILRHGKSWTLGGYPSEVSASPQGRSAQGVHVECWLDRCVAAWKAAGVSLELGKAQTSRKLSAPKPLPEASSQQPQTQQASAEIRQQTQDSIAAARREAETTLKELEGAKIMIATVQQERDSALRDVDKIEQQLKATVEKLNDEQEEVEDLREQLAALKSHEEQMKELEAQLEAQELEQKKQLHKHKMQITSLEAQMAAKDERLKDLQSQVATGAEARRELFRLQEQVKALEERQEREKMKLPGQEDHTQEIEELQRMHEEELTVVHAECARLKDLHDALAVTSKQQEQELQTSQWELADKEDQVETMRGHLRAQLEGKQDLQAQLDAGAGEEELRVLRAQLLAKDEKLKEMEALHAQISGGAESKDLELENLRIKLKAREEDQQLLQQSQEQALHKLDLQVAQLTTQLTTKENHYQQLHELHQVLVSAGEDQERELERLHEQLVIKEDRIKELEPSQALLNAPAEHNLEIVHLRSQLTAQAEVQSRKHENALEDLQARLSHTEEQELSKLQAKLAAQEEALQASSKHASAGNAQELEHFRTKLKLKEEEKRGAQLAHEEEVRGLDLQVARLHAQLTVKDDHYQQLNELHKVLTLAGEDQERELERLHSQLASKDKRMKELEPLHWELEAEKQKYQELERLRVQLGMQAEARTRRHEHESEHLEAQLEEQLKEMSKLQLKNVASSEQHHELQGRLLTHEEQYRQLHDQYASLSPKRQSQFNELEQQRIELQLELDTKKAELADREHQNQELHDQHAVLAQTHKHQEHKVDLLQVQLASHEEQLKQMFDELDTKQAKLVETEQQHQKLHDQHALLAQTGEHQEHVIERLQVQLLSHEEQQKQHQELHDQHLLLTQTGKCQEHMVQHLQTQLASSEEQMKALYELQTEQQADIAEKQEIQIRLVEENDQYQSLRDEYLSMVSTSKQKQEEFDHLESDIARQKYQFQESELEQHALHAEAGKQHHNKVEHLKLELALHEEKLKAMRNLEIQNLTGTEQQHELQVKLGAQQEQHEQLENKYVVLSKESEHQQARQQLQEEEYQQLHDQYAATSPTGAHPLHMKSPLLGMEHLLTGLHSQVEAGHSKLAEKQEQQLQLERQHASLADAHKHQQNNVEQLQLSLESHEEQLKGMRNLQIENVSSTEQQHELQVKLALKKEQHQELHDEYAALLSENKQKQNEVERLETQIASREHQFKESEVEQHAVLADTGKHHKHMVETLQAQLAVHEEHLKGMSNWQMEKITSTEQQHELQVRLASKKEQHQELQGEFAALASRNKQQQHEVDSLHSQLALKEQQVKEHLQATLAAHEEHLKGMSNLQMEKITNTEQQHELQVKLASKKEQHQELQEEYAALASKSKQQQQEVDSLHSQLSLKEQQVTAVESQQYKLQRELDMRPAMERFAGKDSHAAWGYHDPMPRHEDHLQSIKASEDEEESLAKISELEVQKLQSQLKLMQRLQVQLLAREHPMTVQKLEQSVERLQAQLATTLDLQHVHLQLVKQRQTEAVESMQVQLAAKEDENEHEKFMHEQAVRKLNVEMKRLQEELAGCEEEWQRQHDQLQLAANKKQQKEIERLHALLVAKDDEVKQVEELRKQLGASAEQKKEIQDLKDKFQEKEDEQQKLQAAHEDDLHKAALEEARLRDHNHQLQDHHKQLQDLHASLGTTSEQQQVEIDQLRAKVTAQEEQMKDMKSVQVQLAFEKEHSQELDRLRAHIASQAEARIRRQEQEVEHLRMQLNTREEQLKEIDALQSQLSMVAGPQDLQQVMAVFAAKEEQRRTLQMEQHGQLRAEQAALIASRGEAEEEIEVLQRQLRASEDAQCKQVKAAEDISEGHLEEAARLRVLGQEALQKLEQTVVSEREGRRRSREVTQNKLEEMHAGLAAKEKTAKAQALQIGQMQMVLAQKAWDQSAEMQTMQIAQLQRELAAQGQIAQAQTMHLADLQSELVAGGQTAHAETLHIAHLQNELSIHSLSMEGHLTRPAQQTTQQELELLHSKLAAQGQTAQAQTMQMARLQSELLTQGEAAQAQIMRIAHLQTELAFRSQTAESQTMHLAEAQRACVPRDADAETTWVLNPSQKELEATSLSCSLLQSDPEHQMALPAQWQDSGFDLQSEAERKVDVLEGPNKSPEADPAREMQGCLREDQCQDLVFGSQDPLLISEVRKADDSTQGVSSMSSFARAEAEHSMGALVQIQGLPSKPSLNEHVAEVLEFDSLHQQYRVLLRTDGSVQQISACNLCKVDEPTKRDEDAGDLGLNKPKLASTWTAEAPDCRNERRSGSISGTLHGSADSEHGSVTRRGRLLSWEHGLEPVPGSLCLPRPSPMGSRRPSAGSVFSSTGWGKSLSGSAPWPRAMPSSADSNSDGHSEMAGQGADSPSESEESHVELPDQTQLNQLNALGPEPSFGELAGVSGPNRLTDSMPTYAREGTICWGTPRQLPAPTLMLGTSTGREASPSGTAADAGRRGQPQLPPPPPSFGPAPVSGWPAGIASPEPHSTPASAGVTSELAARIAAVAAASQYQKGAGSSSLLERLPAGRSDFAAAWMACPPFPAGHLGDGDAAGGGLHGGSGLYGKMREVQPFGSAWSSNATPRGAAGGATPAAASAAGASASPRMLLRPPRLAEPP